MISADCRYNLTPRIEQNELVLSSFFSFTRNCSEQFTENLSYDFERTESKTYDEDGCCLSRTLLDMCNDVSCSWKCRWIPLVRRSVVDSFQHLIFLHPLIHVQRSANGLLLAVVPRF